MGKKSLSQVYYFLSTFSLLADHLGLLRKRQMYEAQPQKELFGSYGEDEEKGGL